MPILNMVVIAAIIITCILIVLWIIKDPSPIDPKEDEEEEIEE